MLFTSVTHPKALASRFASVLEEEILKVNEEETPLKTKKATKFGVLVFDGKFLFFLLLYYFFPKLVELTG